MMRSRMSVVLGLCSYCSIIRSILECLHTTVCAGSYITYLVGPKSFTVMLKVWPQDTPKSKSNIFATMQRRICILKSSISLH